MIKESFIIIMCCVCFPLFSQDYKYYESDFISRDYHAGKSTLYNSSYVDSFALNHRISKVEWTSTNFNEKHTRAFTTLHKDVFDRNGRMVEQTNLMDTGKKQKIGRSSNRRFNEFGKVSYSSHFFYGRNYFKMFEYNDSHRLVKQVNLSDKGIYSVIETLYGEGDLYNLRVYKDRKDRVVSRYNYYYYPNREFRQVVLSDRKGKIVKVWDYACDETGKSLKKLKDTAKICTLKSYLPDGTIITTTQSFDYYGHPWKIVHLADSTGKLLKYSHYSGKDEMLVYEALYTYKGSKMASAVTLNNYKSQSYKRETGYDTAGKIVSEIYSVGKTKGTKRKVYKTNYSYNQEGFMTERNVFVDSRLKTSEKFRYEFFTAN